MTSRTSREWAAAAAGLFAAFVAVTLWVRFQGPLPGDGPARRWALDSQVGRSEAVSNLQQFFAGLGSPLTAVLLTLTAATVTLRNVGAAAAALVLLGAAVALLEHPVARIVGETDAAAALGQTSGGYPSGHVLFMTGAGGVLAWLGARHRRPEVTAIAVVLALLMGISRVADRSHLPDEVLGGYLLGGAWFCLVVWATRFTAAS